MKNLVRFFTWLVVCRPPVSSLFPSLNLTDLLLTWEECGQKALPSDNASFLFCPSYINLLARITISVRKLGDKRRGAICLGRSPSWQRTGLLHQWPSFDHHSFFFLPLSRARSLLKNFSFAATQTLKGRYLLITAFSYYLFLLFRD